MTTFTPRCPHCATSIDVSVGLWERLRFWAEHTIYCPSCNRHSSARDSVIMGDAYGRWAEQFSGQLRAQAQTLPIIQQVEARRIMDTRVHDEDIHLMSSEDALVGACLRQARAILLERAHGQEITLDVAPLADPQVPASRIGVILARSSMSTGEKEWLFFFARISKIQFVAYAPPAHIPIDQRVRDAIRIHNHIPQGYGNQAAVHA